MLYIPLKIKQKSVEKNKKITGILSHI